MKKPYLKKHSKHAGFTVWIVDGKYIRDKIDEEFTNYGQHYKFNFIPKKEFWIDKERVSSEEKYFIGSMLVMNRLMANGFSHKEAAKKAEKVELMERNKSRLMQKEIKLKENHKKLLESIHKKLIRKYSNKDLKVWIVNGEAVRDLFFLDFTEGGHHNVYYFVPKNEVWIDDDLNTKELKFVILHELHERNLMSKGMNYDNAHKKSSEIEYFCRRHPDKLDLKLKEELGKSSSHY